MASTVESPHVEELDCSTAALQPPLRSIAILTTAIIIAAVASAAALACGDSVHVAGSSGATDAIYTSAWILLVIAATSVTSGSSIGIAAACVASLGVVCIGMQEARPRVALAALGISVLLALHRVLLRHVIVGRAARLRSVASMGGASVLGALLAVTMLALRPGGPSNAPAAALVAVIGVPLADASLCLGGRLLHRKPILVDRPDHIRDRLVRLGLSELGGSALTLATCVVAMVIGLWFAATPPGRTGLVVISAIGTTVWILLLAVPAYSDPRAPRITGCPLDLPYRISERIRHPEESPSTDDEPVEPSRVGEYPGVFARLYERTRRRVQEAEPATAPDRFSFWVAAIAAGGTVAIAFVTLWFFERLPWGFDDLGLFNPAYMFVRTGTVGLPTAPYGGTLHSMYALPPTHYFILGLLMLVTRLPVEGAAVIPVIAWIALGAFAILVARWSLPWKLGVLAGLYAGLVLWSPQAYIRPDADMTGAFIAGLLTLEAGRSREFDWRLLAIGSFSLTLSSALHYVATPAFLGVAVYALWAWLRLGRRASRALVALAAGGLLVGLPYLALFVVPNLRGIASNVRSVNGGFDPVSAIRAHIGYYHAAGTAGQGGDFLHSLVRPVTWSGLPVLLLTTPFLWVRRETRGIALASLPLLLFVLLFDSVPVAEGEIHISPEITLYLLCVFAAAVLVLASLVRWALSNLLRPGAADATHLCHAIVGIAGGALIWTVVTTGTPYVDSAFGTPTWHPLHDEMGLARAAAVSIVGSHASEAASDYSLWYISGASTWSDGLHAVGITEPGLLNVAAYVRGFSALPEGNVGTTAGLMLKAGAMGVRGFYLDREDSSLDYLLEEPRPGGVPFGYVRYGLSLYRLQPAWHIGAWRFVVVNCTDNAVRSIQSATSFAAQAEMTTYLPTDAGGVGWGPVPGGSALITLVARANLVRTWNADGRFAGCRLLYDVSMSESSIDPAALIAKERRAGSGRTIHFPDVPRALNALYSPDVAVTPAAVLTLHRSDAIGYGRLTRSGREWVLTTSPLLWSEALQVPIVANDDPILGQVLPSGPLPPGRAVQQAAAAVTSSPRSVAARSWIEIIGSVGSGNPGVCVLDLANRDCLIRRELDRSLPGPWFLPIPPSSDPIALYVDNEGTGPAKLFIRAINVLTSAG